MLTFTHITTLPTKTVLFRLFKYLTQHRTYHIQAPHSKNDMAAPKMQSFLLTHKQHIKEDGAESYSYRSLLEEGPNTCHFHDTASDWRMTFQVHATKLHIGTIIRIPSKLLDR